MTSERYTHGHHESVLRSHSWRSAENSAAYLLAFLEPGQRLLDLGCGPGTITAGLAERTAPGGVLGIDRAPAVLEVCRANLAAAGFAGVTLVGADAYRLPVADQSFEVVHAHQVLQHLRDPVAALVEMRRACAIGGVVAVRDADYPAMAWFPEDALLDRWMSIYLAVARSNGGEPAAGRRLLAWAHAAGFSDVAPSASLWCHATPEERSFWGGMWAERITDSDLARQALAGGQSTAEELGQISAAWRRWAADPDGWFVVPHGELVCRR